MLSFSERMGFKSPKSIQLDDLDRETRASLWNVCKRWTFFYEQYFLKKDHMLHLAQRIYEYFYKLPIDELPMHSPDFIASHLKFFNEARWYRVLDLIEFISHNIDGDPSNKTRFDEQINKVLEIEKSAFRFVGGVIIPLSNEIEIAEIDAASQRGGTYAPVATHIEASLESFGKKPIPDYRNSIKEAICAVESAAMITSGTRVTLGEVLKKLDMHEALRQSMLKLYGYTSDEGGIRHALSDAAKIDEADARYMLVTCSACSNFLIDKAAGRQTIK